MPMHAFILNQGREKSLLRHHPWIFSKAVNFNAVVPTTKHGNLAPNYLEFLRLDPQKDNGKPPLLNQYLLKSGELCAVLDAKGEFLCYAHYSAKSQIMLRAISFNQNDHIDYDFIKNRIKKAIAKRRPLTLRGDDGMRLVAAEGDYLPGLIVDRFNNIVSFAISSWGMEAVYTFIIKALHELLPDCYLYERSDSKSRLKEDLPLRCGLIDPNDINPQYNLKTKDGVARKDSKQITSVNGVDINTAIPDTIYVKERDLVKIPIDVKSGHKTGGYLDQRQSRYHTYELCKMFKALSEDGKKGPSVLNCFSYTGGFGLFALKGGASAVYNIDVSELALTAAKNGVVHNHLDPGRCRFIKKDVFAYLREEVEKGTKFDIVILDPPKFAENKSNLATACRGYQDINRLGMQLVKSGGRLLTFSCSGLMTEDLFQKIIADAALDAKVDAQLVSTLRQDIDHLVALPCPESFYLKGFEILIN